MAPRAPNNNQFKYPMDKMYSNPENRAAEYTAPQNHKQPRFLTRFDILILLIMGLPFLLYLLTYIETISWNLSALGRLFMIKYIVYFDWSYLKNKQCLINNNRWKPPNDAYDCGTCETLKNINVYQELTKKNLEDQYIKRDIPVIIDKHLNDWPKDSSFIDELKYDNYFFYSYPCNLSTNVLKGKTFMGEVLEQVNKYEEFYVHFQNCDFEAMKSLRRYTYKPDIIPNIYSPTTSNWLLWSKEYNTSNMKRLPLTEKLIIFGQINGRTDIQLIPKGICQFVCSALNIYVESGEIMVVTDAWHVEYRPGSLEENMAVILEIRD